MCRFRMVTVDGKKKVLIRGFLYNTTEFSTGVKLWSCARTGCPVVICVAVENGNVYQLKSTRHHHNHEKETDFCIMVFTVDVQRKALANHTLSPEEVLTSVRADNFEISSVLTDKHISFLLSSVTKCRENAMEKGPNLKEVSPDSDKENDSNQLPITNVSNSKICDSVIPESVLEMERDNLPDNTPFIPPGMCKVIIKEVPDDVRQTITRENHFKPVRNKSNYHRKLWQPNILLKRRMQSVQHLKAQTVSSEPARELQKPNSAQLKTTESCQTAPNQTELPPLNIIRQSVTPHDMPCNQTKLQSSRYLLPESCHRNFVVSPSQTELQPLNLIHQIPQKNTPHMPSMNNAAFQNPNQSHIEMPLNENRLQPPSYDSIPIHLQSKRPPPTYYESCIAAFRNSNQSIAQPQSSISIHQNSSQNTPGTYFQSPMQNDAFGNLNQRDVEQFANVCNKKASIKITKSITIQQNIVISPKQQGPVINSQTLTCQNYNEANHNYFSQHQRQASAVQQDIVINPQEHGPVINSQTPQEQGPVINSQTLTCQNYNEANNNYFAQHQASAIQQEIVINPQEQGPVINSQTLTCQNYNEANHSYFAQHQASAIQQEIVINPQEQGPVINSQTLTCQNYNEANHSYFAQHQASAIQQEIVINPQEQGPVINNQTLTCQNYNEANHSYFSQHQASAIQQNIVMNPQQQGPVINSQTCQNYNEANHNYSSQHQASAPTQQKRHWPRQILPPPLIPQYSPRNKSRVAYAKPWNGHGPFGDQAARAPAPPNYYNRKARNVPYEQFARRTWHYYNDPSMNYPNRIRSHNYEIPRSAFPDSHGMNPNVFERQQFAPQQIPNHQNYECNSIPQIQRKHTSNVPINTATNFRTQSARTSQIHNRHFEEQPHNFMYHNSMYYPQLPWNYPITNTPHNFTIQNFSGGAVYTSNLPSNAVFSTYPSAINIPTPSHNLPIETQVCDNTILPVEKAKTPTTIPPVENTKNPKHLDTTELAAQNNDNSNNLQKVPASLQNADEQDMETVYEFVESPEDPDFDDSMESYNIKNPRKIDQIAKNKEIDLLGNTDEMIESRHVKTVMKKYLESKNKVNSLSNQKIESHYVSTPTKKAINKEDLLSNTDKAENYQGAKRKSTNFEKNLQDTSKIKKTDSNHNSLPHLIILDVKPTASVNLTENKFMEQSNENTSLKNIIQPTITSNFVKNYYSLVCYNDMWYEKSHKDPDLWKCLWEMCPAKIQNNVAYGGHNHEEIIESIEKSEVPSIYIDIIKMTAQPFYLLKVSAIKKGDVKKASQIKINISELREILKCKTKFEQFIFCNTTLVKNKIKNDEERIKEQIQNIIERLMPEESTNDKSIDVENIGVARNNKPDNIITKSTKLNSSKIVPSDNSANNSSHNLTVSKEIDPIVSNHEEEHLNKIEKVITRLDTENHSSHLPILKEPDATGSNHEEECVKKVQELNATTITTEVDTSVNNSSQLTSLKETEANDSNLQEEDLEKAQELTATKIITGVDTDTSANNSSHLTIPNETEATVSNLEEELVKKIEKIITRLDTETSVNHSSHLPILKEPDATGSNHEEECVKKVQKLNAATEVDTSVNNSSQLTILKETEAHDSNRQEEDLEKAQELTAAKIITGVDTDTSANNSSHLTIPNETEATVSNHEEEHVKKVPSDNSVNNSSHNATILKDTIVSNHEEEHEETIQELSPTKIITTVETDTSVTDSSHLTILKETEANKSNYEEELMETAQDSNSTEIITRADNDTNIMITYNVNVLENIINVTEDCSEVKIIEIKIEEIIEENDEITNSQEIEIQEDIEIVDVNTAETIISSDEDKEIIEENEEVTDSQEIDIQEDIEIVDVNSAETIITSNEDIEIIEENEEIQNSQEIDIQEEIVDVNTAETLSEADTEIIEENEEIQNSQEVDIQEDSEIVDVNTAETIFSSDEDIEIFEENEDINSQEIEIQEDIELVDVNTADTIISSDEDIEMPKNNNPIDNNFNSVDNVTVSLKNPYCQQEENLENKNIECTPRIKFGKLMRQSRRKGRFTSLDYQKVTKSNGENAFVFTSQCDNEFNNHITKIADNLASKSKDPDANTEIIQAIKDTDNNQTQLETQIFQKVDTHNEHLLTLKSQNKEEGLSRHNDLLKQNKSQEFENCTLSLTSSNSEEALQSCKTIRAQESTEFHVKQTKNSLEATDVETTGIETVLRSIKIVSVVGGFQQDVANAEFPQESQQKCHELHEPPELEEMALDEFEFKSEDSKSVFSSELSNFEEMATNETFQAKQESSVIPIIINHVFGRFPGMNKINPETVQELQMIHDVMQKLSEAQADVELEKKRKENLRLTTIISELKKSFKNTSEICQEYNSNQLFNNQNTSCEEILASSRMDDCPEYIVDINQSTNNLDEKYIGGDDETVKDDYNLKAKEIQGEVKSLLSQDDGDNTNSLNWNEESFPEEVFDESDRGYENEFQGTNGLSFPQSEGVKDEELAEIQGLNLIGGEDLSQNKEILEESDGNFENEVLQREEIEVGVIVETEDTLLENVVDLNDNTDSIVEEEVDGNVGAQNNENSSAEMDNFKEYEQKEDVKDEITKIHGSDQNVHIKQEICDSQNFDGEAEFDDNSNQYEMLVSYNENYCEDEEKQSGNMENYENAESDESSKLYEVLVVSYNENDYEDEECYESEDQSENMETYKNEKDGSHLLLQMKEDQKSREENMEEHKNKHNDEMDASYLQRQINEEDSQESCEEICETSENCDVIQNESASNLEEKSSEITEENRPPNMYYPQAPGYPPHMPPPPRPQMPPQMPPPQQQMQQQQQQQHQQQHQQQMQNSQQPPPYRQQAPRQQQPMAAPRQPMQQGPRAVQGGPRGPQMGNRFPSGPRQPGMVPRQRAPMIRGRGGGPMMGSRGPRPRMPMQNGGQMQGMQQQNGPRMIKRSPEQMQALQAKRKKMDVLVPDKHDDADCQVIAVTPKNTGLPQIQSIQGAATDAGDNSVMHLSDSITLSVRNPPPKPASPKKSDAKDVANILATRGITVTATAKSKEAAKATSKSPEPAVPVAINLNSSVCIIPTKNQGVNSPSGANNKDNKLATVDLTDDTVEPQPPQQQKQMPGKQQQTNKVLPFQCDLCPAKYTNSLNLSKHRQSFHKTGSNVDYGVPLIDLKSPGVVQRLASLGIHNYIPLPGANSETTFALPIINANTYKNGNLNNIGATQVLTLGPVRMLPKPVQNHK